MSTYNDKTKACITVWLDRTLEEEFTQETRKLGLTRSQVLRQLVKGWLIRRNAKRRPEVEEFV